MTVEQLAALADIQRTLTTQLTDWVHREVNAAFAALAVEMERAAGKAARRRLPRQ
jgi:hypothetical protein